MTPDPLLLLPLAAVALALLYPIFDKRMTQGVSRSMRSRKRRLIILGRLTVVVLPLAALLAEIWTFWPERFWGKALQGSLIAAAVLLPLYVAHLVVSVRRARVAPVASDKGQTEVLEPAWSDDVSTTDDRAPPRARGGSPPLAARATEPVVSRASPGLADRELKVPTLHVSNNRADRRAGQATGIRSGRAVSSVRSQTVGFDDEPMSDQLDRVASLVDSIDLGDQPDEQAGARVRSSSEDHGLVHSVEAGGLAASATRAAVEGRSLATIEPPSSRPTADALIAMSDGEIVLWVDKLRDDKRRLQKLVIAQRAAQVSERQAHERTRSAARNVVRSALESQRIAEKIARRERRSRLTVERKYERVASALGNAVSILDARRILAQVAEEPLEGATPAPTSSRSRDNLTST